MGPPVSFVGHRRLGQAVIQAMSTTYVNNEFCIVLLLDHLHMIEVSFRYIIIFFKFFFN